VNKALEPELEKPAELEIPELAYKLCEIEYMMDGIPVPVFFKNKV
jgi:hypothetical protein